MQVRRFNSPPSAAASSASQPAVVSCSDSESAGVNLPLSLTTTTAPTVVTGPGGKYIRIGFPGKLILCYEKGPRKISFPGSLIIRLLFLYSYLQRSRRLPNRFTRSRRRFMHRTLPPPHPPARQPPLCRCHSRRRSSPSSNRFDGGEDNLF